jgi:hypothetical protein
MDPWSPIQFLIGSWSSPVSGQPGEGVSGSSTFSYELNGNVILRKSRAEFAPAPGEQVGLVHDDLLVIYHLPGETQPRAIYFDNEGHVINYVVSFPERQPGIVFESDPSAPGPHARLIYETDPDGVLHTEFFVEIPGGTLISHVKGTLIRNT